MTQALVFIVVILLGILWCGAVMSLREGLGKLRAPAASNEPSLSILVAARNEAAAVADCVKSLIAQDYHSDRLEIVLIDDGSGDGTAEIAKEAAGGVSFFRVIAAPQPPEGVSPKKNALLAGIAATTNEVILTTDADCRPGPGWARGMAAYFEDGVSAVVGHSPVRNADCGSRIGERNPKSEIRNPKSFWLARFDSFVNAVVAAGAIGQGNPVTAAGRNFAYRRSAFKAVGGYGTGVAGASGDDDLLLQRMAKGGAKVRFAINPETFVLASGAATFGEWLRVKRRHLSAGKRYSFLFILLAAVLYIFNVGMVVTAGMSIAGMIPWHWPFWLWGVKALADGATLAKGAIILEERNWVGAWLVAELLSPLLFTAMVPLSLSGKVRWKGRELSR